MACKKASPDSNRGLASRRRAVVPSAAASTAYPSRRKPTVRASARSAPSSTISTRMGAGYVRIETSERGRALIIPSPSGELATQRFASTPRMDVEGGPTPWPRWLALWWLRVCGRPGVDGASAASLAECRPCNAPMPQCVAAYPLFVATTGKSWYIRFRGIETPLVEGKREEQVGECCDGGIEAAPA